jgi:hypothetical protein
MTERLVCFLLSLSTAYPAYHAVAAAQTESSALAQGVRQVEEGDLATAIITLDGVVQTLSTVKGGEKDLATAHLYLGMAHLGLSQWERAKVEMREAWRNNKGMKLDPMKFPPRVIQAFEAAKAEGVNVQRPAVPVTQVPVTAPADAGNSKKGGSSKALLIVGGLALAGGGVALAGGGGSSPPPTPAPAGPTTVLAVSGTLRGAVEPSARFLDYEASASQPGTVEATLTTVSPSNALLGLVIYFSCNAGNACDEVNNTSNPTARAISARVPAGRIVLRVHDFPGRNAGDVTFAVTVTLR